MAVFLRSIIRLMMIFAESAVLAKKMLTEQITKEINARN